MAKKLSKKESKNNILKVIQKLLTVYPQSVDKKKYNNNGLIYVDIITYPHIHRTYCF
jgi:hypothetical protein